MPEPIISLSTPLAVSAAKRPAANDAAASDAGTPFSEVLAQKLDRTSPLADKPTASEPSNSEQQDAAAEDDVAAVTAPAGQILPPDGNALQLATDLSTLVSDATLVPSGQDGAAVTAGVSPVAGLNGTGVPQPVNSANGASNLEGQDVQQVPALGQLQDQAPEQSWARGRSAGQSSLAGASTGSEGDVSTGLTQLAAANTASVDNAQQLTNHNAVAGKLAEGAVQALAGLAAQPDTAAANSAPTPLSGLSASSPLSPNTPSATAPASTAIPLPITHPDWDQALGQRVMWLVNQNVQGAELRINPPQLGPVEMRIVMNNDQATVSFTSQHAAVREALEAAVPRLRDMLSDNGLNLANVNVSQHSFAQQRQDNPYAANPSAPSSYGERSESAELATPGVVTRVISGLVDLYA